MSAIIHIQPDYDLVYLLGLVGADPGQALLRDDSLEVDGVTQADLDAALVQYTAQHDQRVADNAARQAMDAVNRAAGACRRKYLTDAFGQELVYAVKERQAREYKAAGYTGTAPEFVAGEATSTGVTDQVATDTIIAKADNWISIGAQIDQAKRSASVQIDAAKTAGDTAAITAARDTAIAAIEAL